MDDHNINQTFSVVNLEQRSPEWYSFRRGKIGASDASSILGLNPWESPLQAWERIVLGTQKEMNDNMRRGIRLEPEALSWSIKQIKSNFKPVVVQSKNHPDLIASLDGWDGKDVLEIKCPRVFSKSIPEYYNAQMQHQMFITNSKNCWYVEYVEGNGILQLVERDEEFIQEMLAAELRFLASLFDFRSPEPTYRDWVIQTDSMQLKRASRYKELTLLIEELASERNELREDLIEWAPHSRTRCGDLNLTKVISKGRIAYDKLLADHPEINQEKYRTEPQTSWRLTRASS